MARKLVTVVASSARIHVVTPCYKGKGAAREWHLLSYCPVRAERRCAPPRKSQPRPTSGSLPGVPSEVFRGITTEMPARRGGRLRHAPCPLKRDTPSASAYSAIL